MGIIKITDENLAEHLDDLVALSAEFLQIVCDQAPRGSGEGGAVIESMVASAPPTAIVKVEGDDGAAIGVSYFNHGIGYACGGAYLGSIASTSAASSSARAMAHACSATSSRAGSAGGSNCSSPVGI
jgi:hypothetical protein